MNPIRRYFGLRWRKSYPTFRDIHKGDLAVVLAVVLAYAVVMWNDARSETIVAQAQTQSATKQFTDFLNGGILTNPEQTLAVKCERLLTVTN